MNENTKVWLNIFLKLQEYGDLDPYLIMKLLCRVGDTVYRIFDNEEIIPMEIVEVHIEQYKYTGIYISIKCIDKINNVKLEYTTVEIGEKVFLRKEDAEKELIRRKKNDM
jgi:hypothetical protein